MLIAKRKDLKYPIFIHVGNDEIVPNEEYKIHINIDSKKCTCYLVGCIDEGCSFDNGSCDATNMKVILNFFPKLLKTHPEYFI